MCAVYRNLVGTRFGRLLVEVCAGTNGHRRLWICRCDCGNVTTHSTDALSSGKTRSCGCLKREIISHGAHTTHGQAGLGRQSSAYRTWRGMKNRCENNPKHQAFSRYSGRGIRICARWKKFENFYLDMGDRPDGMSLDRINPDGHYCPSNCRWATRVEQARNRSRQ